MPVAGGRDEAVVGDGLNDSGTDRAAGEVVLDAPHGGGLDLPESECLERRWVGMGGFAWHRFDLGGSSIQEKAPRPRNLSGIPPLSRSGPRLSGVTS